MDLVELKKRREEKIREHKLKKRAYYLKSKIQKEQKNIQKVSLVNYEVELFGGDLTQKLRDIAKKQRLHMDSREKIIKQKFEEYRNKKQQYYEANKEIRLEYDKEYRDKKKEKLKEYRKEYYRKNKEKILKLQKENRLKHKLKD